jgi:hypothetical protein
MHSGRRRRLAVGWLERTENDSGDFVVRVEFVVDGREGAKFEVGDVSEDGGAAGGESVLDQEAEQLG